MQFKPITDHPLPKPMTVLACFLQIFHPLFKPQIHRRPIMEFAISQGHQLLIDSGLTPFSFDRLEAPPGENQTFSSARDKIACARMF